MSEQQTAGPPPRRMTNDDLASGCVLVERRGAAGAWSVHVWHGVTSLKTGGRAGARLVRSFAAGEEGFRQAGELAGLLRWWMRTGLNLYGDPTRRRPPRPAAARDTGEDKA